MKKDAPASLTLEELCAEVETRLRRTGILEGQPDGRVSAAPDARTVRYYTTLGLLGRPRIVDRQARYGPRHVLQLVAVKALQAAALPLAEIQERLYGRSDRELESLLASLGEERRRRAPEVQPVRWREVVVEPGLKILAEEKWLVTGDVSALLNKVGAAVAALGKAPRGQNGGSQS